MTRAGPGPAAAGAIAGGRAMAARAKLNLTLAVVGRRPDGFHALDSVFLRIALADELRGGVAPAGAADDVLEVTGDAGSATHDNLVLRAARALRAVAGATDPAAAGTDARLPRDRHETTLPPLAFHLEKRVPVAAGLGGGSADAAAALRLAASLWGLDLPAADWLGLAARIGSDVPFFAADLPAARVTGRGEHLEALPPPAAGLAALIVVAGPPLSTAAVFARYAERPTPARDESGPTGAALATAHLTAVLRRAPAPSAVELVAAVETLSETNDLWDAAATLDPGLRRRRAELEARLGRRLLLSGSGPSLFCLYPSLEAAMDGLDTCAALAGPLGLRQVLVSGFA